MFLGVALAKQKKFDEAAAHYQAALKLEPKFAVAHNNLARLLHTQGRLDDAIEHYQAALKYDPTLAEAHNNLGTLWLQKGKLAEGTAQLREALRLNPGNAETELNLAMALNQQQKWEEAAVLFGKVASNFSTDANAPPVWPRPATPPKDPGSDGTIRVRFIDPIRFSDTEAPRRFPGFSPLPRSPNSAMARKLSAWPNGRVNSRREKIRAS